MATGHPVKMSRLTGNAVSPSNIEKQKTNLALQVFCQETASALILNSATKDSSQSTSRFLRIFSKFFTICNVKDVYSHIKRNDEFSSVDSTSLEYLRKIAKLAKFMTSCQKRSRIRSLTPGNELCLV